MCCAYNDPLHHLLLAITGSDVLLSIICFTLDVLNNTTTWLHHLGLVGYGLRRCYSHRMAENSCMLLSS